jgi:hypothetical protein
LRLACHLAPPPQRPSPCVYGATRTKADANIVWDDPDIGIAWPILEPSLSPKDAAAPRLKDAAVLPRFSPTS